MAIEYIHYDDTVYDDNAIVSDFRTRYGVPTEGGIAPAALRRFRSIIYGYFRRYGRDFPWRRTTDPYHILVSEIMLQQTQTGRAAEKFTEFIAAFPDMGSLAAAPMHEVMTVWQGLGYNRRARHLHELSVILTESRGGRVPDDPAELSLLPGIGKATAASICAFAFNRPTVFLETNIRSVFIHFFFPEREKVDDLEIMPMAEAALDRKDPHRWYSALMDFGAMLKKRRPNPSRKSSRHRKQGPFIGSRRQVRGLVLKTLLAHPGTTLKRLSEMIARPEDTVTSVAEDLLREGLVKKKGRSYYI